MSGSVSRFLNGIGDSTSHAARRALKRQWDKTPRNERAALRRHILAEAKKIEAYIEEQKPKTVEEYATPRRG